MIYFDDEVVPFDPEDWERVNLYLSNNTAAYSPENTEPSRRS